jgi:hypothetical protein
MTPTVIILNVVNQSLTTVCRLGNQRKCVGFTVHCIDEVSLSGDLPGVYTPPGTVAPQTELLKTIDDCIPKSGQYLAVLLSKQRCGSRNRPDTVIHEIKKLVNQRLRSAPRSCLLAILIAARLSSDRTSHHAASASSVRKERESAARPVRKPVVRWPNLAAAGQRNTRTSGPINVGRTWPR